MHKIKNPLSIKTLNKVGVEGIYLKLTKAISPQLPAHYTVKKESTSATIRN